jgi:hypothetical protein
MSTAFDLIFGTKVNKFSLVEYFIFEKHNKDAQTLIKKYNVRDQLLGNPSYVAGGIAYFNGLDHTTLQKLVDLKFADPDETQNDSPCINFFLEFIKTYPTIKAHGYIVHPSRDDARVSIEGLLCESDFIPEDLVNKFKNVFHDADELEANSKKLRCWYD